MTPIDVALTASASEIAWALLYSILAFGFGFVIGTKLKLIRKLEEMV